MWKRIRKPSTDKPTRSLLMPFSGIITPQLSKESKRKENMCPGAALHLCSASWPAQGWLGVMRGMWGPQPRLICACQAIHLPMQPQWCGGRAAETSTSPAFCWWRGAGVFVEPPPRWGEQQGRPDCSWNRLEITIDENRVFLEPE